VANQPNMPITFSYRAQTRDGQTITGTIEANDLADARHRLESLSLSLTQIEPAPRAARGASLRGDDFAAFNQQLAQLTGAGLPVEYGLRLIASEMGSSSLRQTLNQVAADLEGGKSLPQAIDAHRSQFPRLYASLVDAGIRAGNLPRVLLNLGRHLTLVRRLQAMMWRTFSYPIIVMIAFFGLFCFLMIRVIPQFRDMYRDYDSHVALPALTWSVMALSSFLSSNWRAVFLGAAVLVLLGVVLLRLVGRNSEIAERLVLRLPLIGPVLRRNLIARWCDAVGIGVEAGMDLPAAIALADDAIASSALGTDGQSIVRSISTGGTVAQARPGKILPPIVIAALDRSVGRNDLSEGLSALSRLYEEQAEVRMGNVEVILTPMIVILMGLVVGLLVLALFAPIISLFAVFS
jgi:type IV pilus assembly protein PilC